MSDPSVSDRPSISRNHFPIKIREVSVLTRTRPTPGMIRLTLGGPGMDGFESHEADEHVKLVLPDEDTGLVRAPTQDGDHLDWPSPFPPTRDYTVRVYRPEAAEFDVDFVVHEGGRAAEWAQTCEIGSTIWVAGPRPGYVVPADFTYQVVVGDETALPAVARWLEEVPAGIRGAAAIEIAGPQERQDLHVPEGWTLTWLDRQGAPPGSTRLMGDFVESLTLPEDEHVFLWASGEAGCLKPIRAWAKQHDLGKGQTIIAGYWKRGKTGAVPPTRLGRASARAKHRLDHLLGREHDH